MGENKLGFAEHVKEICETSIDPVVELSRVFKGDRLRQIQAVIKIENGDGDSTGLQNQTSQPGDQGHFARKFINADSRRKDFNFYKRKEASVSLDNWKALELSVEEIKVLLSTDVRLKKKGKDNLLPEEKDLILSSLTREKLNELLEFYTAENNNQ